MSPDIHGESVQHGETTDVDLLSLHPNRFYSRVALSEDSMWLSTSLSKHLITVGVRATSNVAFGSGQTQWCGCDLSLPQCTDPRHLRIVHSDSETLASTPPAADCWLGFVCSLPRTNTATFPVLTLNAVLSLVVCVAVLLSVSLLHPFPSR